MNKHKPSTDSRNRRLRSCTRRSCASRPLRYKYSRRSRVCFRNIIPYRSKYHVPAILKIPTNKKKDNRPGSISDRISFFFFTRIIVICSWKIRPTAFLLRKTTKTGLYYGWTISYVLYVYIRLYISRIYYIIHIYYYIYNYMCAYIAHMCIYICLCICHIYNYIYMSICAYTIYAYTMPDYVYTATWHNLIYNSICAHNMWICVYIYIYVYITYMYYYIYAYTIIVIIYM